MITFPTTPEAFAYLLGQLREKGQPGDYISVILAVEALANQQGIAIEKHHHDIQAASNVDLEAAIGVLQSDRIKGEELAPGKIETIIEYTQNIIKERNTVSRHG